MEKMVDNPEKDLATTMETGGSLEMVTPTKHFLASTSYAGPSDLTPRAPSIEESLQSMVEYLRNLLPSVERLFLNEQRGEKVFTDALTFFVRARQCLVNSNLDVPTMEKEKIDLLKYRLEHLEKNNTELIKELRFTKETLQEAQESILRQDKKLW